MHDDDAHVAVAPENVDGDVAGGVAMDQDIRGAVAHSQVPKMELVQEVRQPWPVEVELPGSMVEAKAETRLSQGERRHGGPGLEIGRASGRARVCPYV